MPTIFTKIIQGELPGRFVWRDAGAVAFLSIRPVKPGHTLVVPRVEVDHWLDMEPELLAHVTKAAQCVGRGIQRAFACKKVGVAVVGLEVPHVHWHLIPIDRLEDMDFAKQRDASAEELDEAAAKIRAALKELGYQKAAE